MGMSQVWAVLRSDALNRKPRHKLLMIALANFANEKDAAYAHSATLCEVVGVGPEQIRRMKRDLEAWDMLAFSQQHGRGKSQEFQLHMNAFTGGDKTPPLGGVLQQEKPHLFLTKTPPLPQKNPTSNGGPITDQRSKRGAASARIDVLASNEAAGKDARRLGLAGLNCSGAARRLREWLVQDFGEDVVKSWFDGLEPKSITDSDGFVLQAASAFRMKGACERFGNLFETLDVRVTHG